MSVSQRTRPYIRRLIIVSIISTAFVIAFNEVAFYFQKGENDRAPKTIQIIIPAGTAQRINQVDFQPLIPEEQVFVVGDILEVINQDTVSHQLGPIWTPPGSSGTLTLEQANDFTFACSFASNQYLGLEVLQATTLGTRMTAISLAAPTMTALIYLYSLLLIPIHPKSVLKKEEA